MNNSKVLLLDNQGLSHYTCYLASGLAKYRRIVLAGFSKIEYSATGAEKNPGIEFHHFDKPLPTKKSLWNLLIKRPLSIFKFAFKLLIKNNFSIVHVQGHLPLFFLLIPILRLRQRKLVWTIHDIDLRPSTSGVRGKLEIFYVSTISQPNLLMKFSDRIIVHGKHLKNQLIQKGISANKILDIPHFDYMYLDNAAHDCKCNDYQGYVLFFGNIKPYKGLDIFLNALDIVEKKIDTSKFKVVIAGNGSLSPYESLIQGKKREYLLIKNENILNAEIPCLFRKASIVVLPYIEASQSGVVPLAYTFSKPVIVSDIESLQEYVEHGITGFIFEKKNTEQLADCLIDTINHPDLVGQMGSNGHEKLINEMTLDLCCSKINAVYEEISQEN